MKWTPLNKQTEGSQCEERGGVWDRKVEQEKGAESPTQRQRSSACSRSQEGKVAEG
jgi:hypothetical protein